MRIPIINTDAELKHAVARALERANAAIEADSRPEGRFELVPVADHEQATEYINYQMPPLILLNCSDPAIDAFGIVRQVTSDPWLNHGGIIAFYSGHDALNRINKLEGANIIIHLDFDSIERHLPPVLEIVRSNQQILFQRAIQTDLLSSMSGQFVLDLDLLLVPAYANLIANYLYNVGFVDADTKTRVSLVLTEMLTNAIEHGSCGISYEEKARWLDQHGTVQQLIEDKRRDPALNRRRVYFSYEIHRPRSVYVIRDQGEGFAWRDHLDEERVPDVLAAHGRGILLARQSVASMRYNDKGNEVTLEFAHNPGDAPNIPGVFRDNEIVAVQPDDVVFHQGEESDFLYYVADGEYRVEVNGRHVANITPHDILMGEMSFLLEESRSATVTANTPGKLIKISKQDFINIIKNQPYYGLFLSKLIAKRLHRLSRGLLS